MEDRGWRIACHPPSSIFHPQCARPLFIKLLQIKEIASMSKLYGSQSMVAPLRRVLVKRPDQAFAVEDPARWHYTARPDLARAQAEHDALASLLRQAGAEVLYHDEPQP